MWPFPWAKLYMLITLPGFIKYYLADFHCEKCPTSCKSRANAQKSHPERSRRLFPLLSTAHPPRNLWLDFLCLHVPASNSRRVLNFVGLHKKTQGFAYLVFVCQKDFRAGIGPFWTNRLCRRASPHRSACNRRFHRAGKIA